MQACNYTLHLLSFLISCYGTEGVEVSSCPAVLSKTLNGVAVTAASYYAACASHDKLWQVISMPDLPWKEVIPSWNVHVFALALLVEYWGQDE